jgi:hypothetical protein
LSVETMSSCLCWLGLVMLHLLSPLAPALDTIASHTDVLPAAGHVVEELLRPDHEEAQDAYLSREDARVEVILEAPNRELYVHTPPLSRTDRHVFRYFVDGSQSTLFIGTAIQRDQTSPIQIAQIGAAVVHRDAVGHIRLHRQSIEHRLLLLLSPERLPNDLWRELQQLWVPGQFEIIDIAERTEELMPDSSSVDARLRGVGTASALMQKIEAEMTMQVANSPRDGWLVIDGSARLKGFARAERTIAVAKSFSKAPEFSILDRRDHIKSSITRLIANLPPDHRTTVFSALHRSMAFWYVRLRPQHTVTYPLMGVVKVEMPNPSLQDVDSEQINWLSRALVAERSVTPYGLDPRWPVHLYPIFLAEQAIKSRMISVQVLEHCIQWPRAHHGHRP